MLTYEQLFEIGQRHGVTSVKVEEILKDAAGESVAEVRIEPDYWHRGHFYEGRRKKLVVTGDIQSLPVGTKLYAQVVPRERTAGVMGTFADKTGTFADKTGRFTTDDSGVRVDGDLDYYRACERQNVALLEAIGYPHEKDTMTSPEEYAAELKRKADAYDTAGVAVGAVDELAEMTARKDAAYEERNKVVAALAKVFPSGIARTAIEGWSEDWHGCVYIDLPTGQVSWHFHDSQARLFAGLPPYTKSWDGHDTPEKYRRLAALGVLASQEPKEKA